MRFAGTLDVFDTSILNDYEIGISTALVQIHIGAVLCAMAALAAIVQVTQQVVELDERSPVQHNRRHNPDPRKVAQRLAPVVNPLLSVSHPDGQQIVTISDLKTFQSKFEDLEHNFSILFKKLRCTCTVYINSGF